ncbi:flagellar biosynthetic protein FliR [Xylophilus sp. ASV27]|uniref:flagellar biosynthetic protein FliR n=1 Tax=Xylophilus sp. ASV27 TaxID=2795129 RepID=UPI0018ECE3C5|nr:flagellar biosynthetic protein FliR [Xylophilus sp. ASV27]
MNIAAALDQLLRGAATPAVHLYPIFLLSIRIAVVLAMTPVFYAMPIPLSIRALIVLALALVLAAGFLSAGTSPVDLQAGHLIEAVFIELGLGVTLALGVLMAFAAFAVAGNLLDVQIGFGIAQVFDPVRNRASPLLVSAFDYVAVIVFFLVDGHHALLRGISYSLDVLPAGVAWPIEASVGTVIRQFTGLFSLGFALAAPVIFCILLVEFALATVARNLPQMNMFAFGIPVKIVVGIAVLSWWLVGMNGAVNRIYLSIYNTWGQLFLDVGRRPVSVEPQSPVPSFERLH